MSQKIFKVVSTQTKNKKKEAIEFFKKNHFSLNIPINKTKIIQETKSNMYE